MNPEALPTAVTAPPSAVPAAVPTPGIIEPTAAPIAGAAVTAAFATGLSTFLPTHLAPVAMAPPIFLAVFLIHFKNLPGAIFLKCD